ncbi:YbaB/EbfC family nucleoid-associated protein [Nonomuraea sp. NPDC050786]|uniref:YbaB/EbfC family nucleoid-associated protein n=1 Tax=Nonomuraea sp. NPDC050786 TaxID=3154840 RepID=UPI0033F5EF22
MSGYGIDPRNIRSQDIDRTTRQVQQAEAVLGDVDELLAEISGAGEADGGHVKASATAEGRILRVLIGQQAVRQGSKELSEQILAAVSRAQDDARRQVEALLREQFQQAVPDAGIDPVALQQHVDRLLG